MNNQTLLLVLGVVFFLLGAIPNAFAAYDGVSSEWSKPKVPRYSNRVLEKRLDNIPISVQFSYNKAIRKYIRDYTIMARKRTERTLGKTFMYFPVFEHFLDKYNLPIDLKALPIIESAMSPTAKSYVGAVGLWQLMIPTARDYGLIIDDYVDERRDPYKATEAAMKHLSMLYDMFEDWTLVLAAYNCGQGRVLRAIEKGKSKNFWKIKQYLPKETQEYIVRYIAANYVMHYYLFHDLHPNFPDYNLTMTETVVVNEYTTFRLLEQETGIERTIIEALNPSYIKGVVPPHKEGNYVTLPIIGRGEVRIEPRNLLVKNYMILN